MEYNFKNSFMYKDKASVGPDVKDFYCSISVGDGSDL